MQQVILKTEMLVERLAPVLGDQGGLKVAIAVTRNLDGWFFVVAVQHLGVGLVFGGAFDVWVLVMEHSSEKTARDFSAGGFKVEAAFSRLFVCQTRPEAARLLC